jgi:hypothetical protein
MINVNQITAQLAKMPDQALQQYAQMHKSDPYTVSLALSESNRRKQMRAAAQMPQGGEPPKVVDQELAQMDGQPEAPPMPQGQAQAMPEDTGIGALPAPNMQGMAEGGIVAFSDGGDVQHFQSGGSAFENWLNSNITPAEQKRRAFLQAEAEATRTVPAPETALEQAARNRERVVNQGFTRGDVRFPAGLTFDTPPVPKVEIPPVAGDGKGIASLDSVAPRAAAPAVPEKDFMAREKEMGERYGPAVDPLEARRKAMTAEEKAGEEEALTRRKAEQDSEMKEMFKGREARISKREGELEKSKDTNTGMAFLEAGLAMMQARGPGLAGIAQGAGVGVKAYAAGIDKIKSAQEKLDDARDRMEELRQNQASMNKREVRDAEKGIRAIVNQGNRDLLAGAEKATGTKEAKVRAAVTSDMAVSEAAKTRAFQAEQGGLDRASREKIASMPPAEIQKISLLGGGDFAKGYEIYKQEAAIPRLYEAYTKQAADPIAGAAFQAKFPTFETYRAGMGGGKGGNIIDIPDASAGAVRPR